MRVRRFVGNNVAETVGKVKRELGPEAVILQTREFREGGFLGFFTKLKVEITAAIEEAPVAAVKPPTENRVYHVDEVKPQQTKPGPDSKEQSGIIKDELQMMRLMLVKIKEQMEGLGAEEKSVCPVVLQRWADHLRERGVNENLVKRLIRRVQEILPVEEWGNDSQVYAQIEASVCQICEPIGLITPGTDMPKVVALIGPTGVGKTTTIGKLAAGFGIVDKRKIALITTDTYRVAAVEQLKTYGEIIGAPVEVAMTPAELRETLNRHMDKELIFIDTAGRSPHHDIHMSELRAFLSKAQPDFTMLVMSATTQSADQLRVYQSFEDLTTHLIFTKLDETVSAGSIINLLGKTTLPTAYLANGQNVPDDIEAATAKLLARYIIGEEMPHA
ncbi:MAG: flagellar biosynthesis protein FlhF [Desulfosporosinus sp.]|nr:flagellar biosynthesis protein FlhF [Desulfosporosinus sp.]